MKRILTLMMVAGVVVSADPAFAQLSRVGPTVATHGFPAWYQDTTGVSLEFCQPLNQAELDGGWCLLLPADTTVPEAFPTRFADEHFYFAGDSALTFPGGQSALLIMAIEAAFATNVAAGEQIVFARIRIRFDAPVTGTYTVYHPYGTDELQGVAGERVFVTEDIGIACQPGQFDCALLGRIGPFLLPSATPGGAELPAITGPVPGKLYIADPLRDGPVTGSPVGQNYFRIVGPAGSGIDVTSNNFTLVGRVFNGAIPGKITVDRASYASAEGAPNKLDVFASAFPTTQSRIPGGLPANVASPVLAFYPGACVVTPAGTLGPPSGVAGVQMINDGSNYYAQTAPAVVPPAVCVGDLTARDLNGQVVPLFSQKSVTDQVTVTNASYNPSSGQLDVKAVSSDTLNAPSLSVLGYGPLVNGAYLSGALLAPPSKVRVASSQGGEADLFVTTGVGATAPPQIPIAGSDTATASEDGGAVTIDVLANDSLGGVLINPAAATVAIVGAPQLGLATVNALQQIVYTPVANAWGNDALAYTVTVVGTDGLPKTSPAAFVSIAITPVNDPPVAVADTASGPVNVSLAINVLANDTDPDGAADLAAAQIVTAPGGGATATVAGGVVTFRATTAGSYTFSYRAVDAAGAVSAPVTVTVNVVGNETLTIIRAEFIQSTLRWRVEGTSTLRAGQTITIAYDNGSLRPLGSSLAGFVIGTAVVDGAGAWALDLRLTSASDARNPAATGLFVIRPNRIRVTSPLGGFATAAIALR